MTLTHYRFRKQLISKPCNSRATPKGFGAKFNRLYSKKENVLISHSIVATFLGIYRSIGMEWVFSFSDVSCFTMLTFNTKAIHPFVRRHSTVFIHITWLEELRNTAFPAPKPVKPAGRLCTIHKSISATVHSSELVLHEEIAPTKMKIIFSNAYPTLLWKAVWCYTILFYPILFYSILLYPILLYTTLTYYTTSYVPYHTTLYYTILYYTILYFIKSL